MHNSVPFPRSYHVFPGKFLAGCYPGDAERSVMEQQLLALLDCGIRYVINLMEEDEREYYGQSFMPYENRLFELAGDRGMETQCHRFPIRDMDVPSRETMIEILDRIDAAVVRKIPVYVHCWGGKGRTGTVVGCYLVRHGLTNGKTVFDRIQELRRETADAGLPSPETTYQRKYIESWKKGM
jgi:hypothetical protein